MDPKEKLEVSEMEKFLDEHEELNRIQSDVLEKVITLVIAALGLIAALAWDEALKHIFEQIFGGAGTVLEEVTYAVVITVVAALISVSLGKFFVKQRKK